MSAGDGDTGAEQPVTRSVRTITGQAGAALVIRYLLTDLNGESAKSAQVYAITGRRAEAELLAARNAHLPSRQALVYAG